MTMFGLRLQDSPPQDSRDWTQGWFWSRHIPLRSMVADGAYPLRHGYVLEVQVVGWCGLWTVWCAGLVPGVRRSPDRRTAGLFPGRTVRFGRDDNPNAVWISTANDRLEPL